MTCSPSACAWIAPPPVAQGKGMLSALDPLGVPVAWDVVSGQQADAPRYIPAIARVREGLRPRGLLYVGDCTMGALEPRAAVQAGGAYDRCPLSEVQVPPTVLATDLAPVWTGAQRLPPVYRVPADGRQELIAEG